MRRRRAERAHEYERPTFTELKERLAANVRLLRAERSWTQEQAAERAQMATQVLQRLEAGDTNATLISVARLCDGFDVDASRLFAPIRRAPSARTRTISVGATSLHEPKAKYEARRPR